MTRYELLDRIGVGGMAEIFRGKAVAAGGFEKPVAIKRILPHLSQDKRFVELLIAEAKVLSLLKHRNIVQIFDVGLGDDGKYFLVMEYVDGRDLRGIQQGLDARRKRMPLDLALHIGAEICEALEHAHAARAPDGKPMTLVHRDVSPSNVLVSRAGEVKLTDFGIAKRAEQETQHGGVRGKFAYISPEQARNEHLDPRSDVFSVGILLWELLTGRRLFSALGDLEALRAVREAAVPRPSDAAPDIPADVDALLMTALARTPQQRPTAGQLAAKLRSIRYALDETVGDPATELAKIIDTADQVKRESRQMRAPELRPGPGPSGAFDAIDHTEATVIRIRTADDFSILDKRAGMAKARSVIEAFEEEETRLAQLSADQLKQLRAHRDSGEVAPPPPRLPGVAPAPPRARRPTDEPTVAQAPIDPLEYMGGASPSFDGEESTRLVIPSRDRRTPAPERLPPTVTPTAPAPALRPMPPPPQPMAAPAYPPPSAPRAYPPPPQPQGYPPPSAHPAPAPGYPPPAPGWGVAPQLPARAASPTAPDTFDRPVFPAPPPAVAGFQPKKQLLQPWMLVVGALLMAVLAFVITRALLS